MATSVEEKTMTHEALEQDFKWLVQILHARSLAEDGEGSYDWTDLAPLAPQVAADNSAYSRFVTDHELNAAERMALMLAMLPYLDPKLLTILYAKGNPAVLHKSTANELLMPTGDTLLYLLGAAGSLKRLEYLYLFDPGHLFAAKSVLFIDRPQEGFSPYSGILEVTPTYRELFLRNKPIDPHFSSEFPARKLKTKLEWEDLVLPELTAEKLKEVLLFQDQEEALRGDEVLGKHLKPGYRCLFHGPSGVGKTLSASLLGKQLGKPVYRVDISQLVSKYIGETSKNLDKLFNLAEDQDWILFFDEGDALFGKRVDTGDNDQKNAMYANQEIAYLLQRIEDYRGLVIVATNKPNNMDSAFGRRFQNSVRFETIAEAERLAMWQELLTRSFKLGRDVNLAQLNKIERFSIAAIYNVVSRVTMLARAQGLDTLPHELLKRCMLDEKVK